MIAEVDKIKQGVNMFVVNHTDIDSVLRDFGIFLEIKCISELQRYDYEKNDPSKKEVRLIVKVELESGLPLVIRFKNESDVTIEIIESQSRFADVMRKNGILIPYQYQSGGAFAKWYQINGYDVIVTVEQFAENEIKLVDAMIAEKTGELLAKMHSISEENNLHVCNKVLFDPFAVNELFDFESFKSLETALSDNERVLFDKIVQKYNAYMDVLAPLKRQPKYAVQGDISNCNLYQTCTGGIGIFDFNRCGDNNLFCDMVMQAVFEARLMDYPNDSMDDVETDILASFVKGYCSIRSFSDEQQNWYLYLYAIINAFWSSDIKWSDGSLTNAVKNKNIERTRKWLKIIWQRLMLLDRNEVHPAEIIPI